MFLLFGAFIAGLLTVLAPCVLPLLPIIIGGSVSGNTKDKKRPLIITASLAISLIVFTLLLKVTSLLINIPPRSINYISGGIIIILGIAILIPGLYARFVARLGIEEAAQKALGKGYNKKESIAGPIITGAALGPVFSSCSPVYAYILATILPVNFGRAFAYIIAYVLGLSIVLLLIGYYGQQFIGRIKVLANPKGTFQRVIGILFILVGLLITCGYDRRFQAYISAHSPFHIDNVTSKLLPAPKNKVDNSQLFNIQPVDAPEFVGIKDWINSEPLTIKQLRGKVVLVDFWTYTCINCIRNNPHIEKWYETYKDDGFVVIGVHAPEFAFEKILANVQQGVKDQGLTYPIALDSDLATWDAYSNRSWPAGYLIDANGQVRRIHEGEGGYKEEEQAIRTLLQEKGANLNKKNETNQSDKLAFKQGQTPETYLGSDRASNFASTPDLLAANISKFKYPAKLDTNQWALNGTWEVKFDRIIARGNSSLKFKYSAKDMYIVAGSETPQNIAVTLDGEEASMTRYAGSDVVDGVVSVGASKLYHLVAHKDFTKDSTIELKVPNGVELNVFTFGS